MSAQKVSSCFQSEDMAIISKIREVKEEATQFKEVLGFVSSFDCICNDIEELTILQEYRKSKSNYKLNKINTLKRHVGKTFKL